MPRNRASRGVLERAGFRQEGLARRYLMIRGVYEDHLLFARLRSDAPASVRIPDERPRIVEPPLVAPPLETIPAAPPLVATGPPPTAAEGHAV
jgi:hypothetical protein